MPIIGNSDGANTALTDSEGAPNSLHDYGHRSAGHHEMKVITLNVNNGTQSLNCFSITGSVEVLRLYGEITTAGTLTDCDSAFFELDDGTAQADITDATGDLGGMAVGTFFIKNAVVGTVMAVANNATGVFTEAASGNKAYFPF